MSKKAGISRRGFLGGALATAGAAGFALAGCSGDDKSEGTPSPGSTQSPAGEPKKGGTIRSYSPAAILSLEPMETAGSSFATPFYSYVVHTTDWYKPGTPLEGGKTWPTPTIGDLATAWETPTPIDWIFHIRSDAVFQNVPPANGRKLVAEDIVKSIDRYRTMPGANTAWDQWTDKYEAPDPTTFTILTKAPYGYMLMNLGSPLTAIIPIEAVDQLGDLKSQAVGSGPYMLKSYARDQGMEVVRHPGYYHKYPYVDGISIKVLPDDSSVQAAYRAGSLDYYTAADKIRADSVQGVAGTSVQKFLDRVYAVFTVNALKNEAFKDIRVREAIDLAIDRKAMMDKLHFGDAELAGPVPPLWPATLPAAEIEEAYKLDVNKAKQLLAAANQENLTFNLEFGTYSDFADRASIIKENLAKAGITVNLKPSEVGTWLSSLMAGNFESTSYRHLRYLSDYIQINSAHSHGWARTEAGYLGVDNDEIDAMLDKINGTTDELERTKLEQDAQRVILKQHGPNFVLYEPYAYWAAYNYLKGYTPTSYGFGLYKYDYWIDKG